MGDVVNIVTHRPHRTGNAVCVGCCHRWVAVTPAGVTGLDCPACGLPKGVFIGLAETELDQWQCCCKGFVFFIDEQGPYCANCGVRPNYGNG